MVEKLTFWHTSLTRIPICRMVDRLFSSSESRRIQVRTSSKERREALRETILAQSWEQRLAIARRYTLVRYAIWEVTTGPSILGDHLPTTQLAYLGNCSSIYLSAFLDLQTMRAVLAYSVACISVIVCLSIMTQGTSLSLSRIIFLVLFVLIILSLWIRKEREARGFKQDFGDKAHSPEVVARLWMACIDEMLKPLREALLCPASIQPSASTGY